VFASFNAAYRTPLELVGDHGSVRAEDALNVEQPIIIEARHDIHIERETVSNHLAYIRQVDAFADAVEGRSQFPVPAEDGWQNQEILDAIIRSMASGRSEEVPRVG